jgi:hypothetical protein
MVGLAFPKETRSLPFTPEVQLQGGPEPNTIFMVLNSRTGKSNSLKNLTPRESEKLPRDIPIKPERT